MTLNIPCSGAPHCTIASTEAVTFLGRVYCPRHSLCACADALAVHRRMTGRDLVDALDILRGAIVGVQLRMRIVGLDSRPAVPEIERAS